MRGRVARAASRRRDRRRRDRQPPRWTAERAALDGLSCGVIDDPRTAEVYKRHDRRRDVQRAGSRLDGSTAVLQLASPGTSIRPCVEEADTCEGDERRRAGDRDGPPQDGDRPDGARIDVSRHRRRIGEHAFVNPRVRAETRRLQLARRDQQIAKRRLRPLEPRDDRRRSGSMPCEREPHEAGADPCQRSERERERR